MSTPGGAGASRGAKAKPTPPLKGSFPLDHFGECKHLMLEYNACMKNSSGNSSQCRELSKKYLECRMTKGLMTPEKFENLGFKGGIGADAPQPAAANAASEKEKQDKKQGFLAGQRYAEKRGTGSTSF